MHGFQLIAGGAQNVGILNKYLHSEAHLVGYALPEWLLARPQFKIFWAVILSITVLVMNGFVAIQRSSQQFFHHQAVNESFAAVSIVHPHIAGRVYMAVGVYGAPFPARISALAAAVALIELVARGAAILQSTQSVLCDLAAELTLKCWGGADVHAGQLALRVDTVKELV